MCKFVSVKSHNVLDKLSEKNLIVMFITRKIITCMLMGSFFGDFKTHVN